MNFLSTMGHPTTLALICPHLCRKLVSPQWFLLVLVHSTPVLGTLLLHSCPSPPSWTFKKELCLPIHKQQLLALAAAAILISYRLQGACFWLLQGVHRPGLFPFSGPKGLYFSQCQIAQQVGMNLSFFWSPRIL